MSVGFSGLFQSVYKLHVTENPNGFWILAMVYLFKSHWLVVIYYWESVYSITVDAGKIYYDCNQLLLLVLAILSWLGDL